MQLETLTRLPLRSLLVVRCTATLLKRHEAAPDARNSQHNSTGDPKVETPRVLIDALTSAPLFVSRNTESVEAKGI